MQVRVRQITNLAKDINALELVHPDGAELPPFEAGAHIDIHLPDGFIRQYSLCNDQSERDRYQIAVLHEQNGRGGSKRVHEQVKAGDIVEISEPKNHFPLDETANNYLLIAGGIGITPIKAMAERLKAIGASFSIYYCAEIPERAAFRELLSDEKFRDHVIFHYDENDPEKRLDLKKILGEYQPGTQLYFCGPGGLINAINRSAEHWPEGTVHYELFSAPVPEPGSNNTESAEAGDFNVQINSTGQVIPIPADKTIVEALREVGVECQTSCEAGICSTCQTHFLSGEVDHQDFILSDEEKTNHLLICCSRGKSGSTLVLDL